MNEHNGAARGIQREKAPEPAGCPLLWAPPNWYGLIQKRKDSQLPWKNCLQDNNKADSVFLVFSPLGDDDANDDGVGNDGANDWCVHTQCKQNLTRSKGRWDSRMICP